MLTEQIGLHELAKYLHGKTSWLYKHIKTDQLPAFCFPHITPKTPIKEAAAQVLEALHNPEGILLMRQSHYRNTKNHFIPQEVHGYTFHHEQHPLIFINTQKSLDEQTQLLFIGMIRIMLAHDGYYSPLFDASLMDSYIESVYYELRNLAGSKEFLQPLREHNPYHEREDALSELFVKAISNAVYSGKLSNRDAGELLDVSEMMVASFFP